MGFHQIQVQQWKSSQAEISISQFKIKNILVEKTLHANIANY